MASYRIVRRIGAGAMGTVYEAERTDPPLRVALETVNPALLSPAALERFPIAVEVLPALRHPGIARIHDTGIHRVEADGVQHELPWFATEYVSGARPLLDYARERGLGLRARLGLLRQVCDAVEHAHQKGVTHRGLKPENLLVDPAGRVKVVDFGVARVLDADRVREALRTSADGMVGALPYLSPEQLAGTAAEVDTRTDVYALGVVAYELLAGRLPIDVRDQAVGRSARRVEGLAPSRPSRHVPELAGGIEAILLKAIEKEPQDRYGGVAALGADVRRYLVDEPVLAHPPTLRYRLRTFVRRHPTLVGAAVAVCLALASGAVVSWQRAERAEALAATRAAEARAERARAGRLLEQLVQRSTRGALEAAPVVQRLGGGADVARDMLRHALDDLRLVERTGGDSPRVRVALAFAYVRYGDAAGSPYQPSLGDLAGAEQSYAHALELVSPVLALEPAPVPARWAATSALRKRGEVLLARREREGAREAGLELLGQALAAAEALHRDVPDELEFVAELARVHDRLGVAYAQAGEVEQAEAHHAEALAGFERLVDAAPRVPTYRYEQALGLQQAAALAWSKGDTEAAREGYVQAAFLLEPLAEGYDPDRRHLERLAWNVLWTGNAERRLGHLDVAAKRFASALRLYRSLGEAGPGDLTIPPLIGSTLWNLGTLAQERADAAEDGSATRRRLLETAVAWFAEAATHLEQQIADGDASPMDAQRLRMLRQRVTAVRALLASERRVR